MRQNATNIAMLALIFVVLACGCPSKLKELARDQPPPAPSPKSDRPTPAPTRSAESGEYDLSLGKYKQIKVGAKRSDVESVLGGSGVEISSTEGGGVRFTVNKWEGDDFQSVIISFRNDKVMSKSQVGLK
jgi:hypothetical protein